MIRNYVDHAANERTFLAWVRSVIAIAGFGIGASRLTGVAGADWIDLAILASGAAVIGAAYLRMRVVRVRIDSPDRENDEAAGADGLLVVMVIALFLLLATFALRLST